MTDGAEIPETIVFDAEPLIAYFCNEPGSDTVETYVDAVEGTADGYISAINLAEVHYIVRAIDGENALMLSSTSSREAASVASTPNRPGRQRPTSNSATRRRLAMPSRSGLQHTSTDAPRRGR